MWRAIRPTIASSEWKEAVLLARTMIRKTAARIRGGNHQGIRPVNLTIGLGIFTVIPLERFRIVCYNVRNYRPIHHNRKTLGGKSHVTYTKTNRGETRPKGPLRDAGPGSRLDGE